MVGTNMISRVIDRLDQINARSTRVLKGYLKDNRFETTNLLEPKMVLMLEKAIHKRLQGYDSDDCEDVAHEDIDDFYQRRGEATYPIFVEELQDIIDELLENQVNVNEGLIFAFFAYSRSEFVKQRLEDASKNQGGPLTETVFYSWEEAFGALDALCVAERLCCKDRKYPTAAKQEIDNLKVSGKNLTRQYKNLHLKEKAFEILEKMYQEDPERSDNSMAIKIIKELDKIEKGFAAEDGNRTVHRWIKEWKPLLLAGGGVYLEKIAREDERDLKDVTRDYILTKKVRRTLQD